MRRPGLLAALCALAGCPAGDDSTEDYPIAPGGGTSASGGGGDDSGDAPPVDGPTVDGASAITGRVCLFAPLRASFRATCATDEVEATVTIDGRTATPLPNGNFAIPLDAPIAGAALFRVRGPGLVPTVMLPTPSPQLLVVESATYSDEAGLYGASLPEPGQGIIVVQVLDAGEPVVGASVVTNDQQDLGTLYDDDVPPLFALNILTGADGLAWISQATVGPNTVTVQPPGTASAVSIVLPVEDGAITFHQFELP